jgi:nitrite reductase/ring-hydroxylating ferredoxin subunit
VKGSPPAGGTVVCALAEIADGKSRVIAFPDGFELIVVRTGEAAFGYVNECKHLQVGLNLLDDHACETNAGTILCQYHYATYRFEDGYCIAGPCQGDALTAVPLSVRAGRVVIATGSAAK